MSTRSFSKRGRFCAAKSSHTPGEFFETMRSISQRLMPKVERVQIRLVLASSDGTLAEHRIESFEELLQIDGRNLETWVMAITSSSEENLRFEVHLSESDWHLDLEANRRELLNGFWAFLEDRFGLRVKEFGQSTPQTKETSPLAPVKMHVFCKPKDLKWQLLCELPSRLAALGFEVKEETVTIRQYPTRSEYKTLRGVLNQMERNGSPRGYDIVLSAPGKWLNISRYTDRSHEEILEVDFHGPGPEEVVGSVLSFLGLERDEPAGKPRLKRTCFVAYRFDEQGEVLARKLTRFLELLGFSVATGRGFAPGSVSEKVKKRLVGQALVFAILSSGEDKTWIVQESTVGGLSDKPLFLLKEKTYQHKGALLNDHEYIEFEAPHIEAAFIQILEGLHALGFEF